MLFSLGALIPWCLHPAIPGKLGVAVWRGMTEWNCTWF